MNTDSGSLSETTAIVSDDEIVLDESTAAANSTITIQTSPYDPTKTATTCVGQFFDNYHAQTGSASCSLCRTSVKKSGDSTFNFVRHVKRHHLGAYNDWKKNLAVKQEQCQLKQPSIKNALLSPRGTKYAHAHPRQVALANMVTNDLIIGLALPLSIVERPEFLRAMATVDSKFVVPSRRTLARDILPKAVERTETELKRICLASQFVSLTLDIWTDRKMRSFYAMTIHLIDQWVFKSHLLVFKHFSGSHTSDRLLEAYEAATTQYHIEKKVVRLITDNASNNIGAFGALVVPGFEPYFEVSVDDFDSDRENEVDDSGQHEKTSDEICSLNDSSFGNEELLRLPCFMHTLQLVVSNSFKESSCVKSSIAKVSSIAKFSHKSTIMAEKLEQDGFCIPIAVITRWNSQYYTVARTIDIPSEKLNAYLKESKKDSLILSQRDIAILNEFVSLFALIAEVSTKAQANQAASVSLVAPSLLEINLDLQAEQTSLKYTGSLCKALLKSMQDRFEGLNEAHV